MFRTLFIRTLNALQPDPDATETLWQQVERAYSEPHRHYHTGVHLDALAAALEPVWEHVEEPEMLAIAIAYHDAVYDPARHDNEERSAELAASSVGALLTEAQQVRLQRHILATKAHKGSDDADTDLFTDADLSILGATPNRYDRYALEVRQEYRIYPDALYRPGRAAVLRNFLVAERLFKTAYFFNKLEAAARENLRRELAQLEGTAV